MKHPITIAVVLLTILTIAGTYHSIERSPIVKRPKTHEDLTIILKKATKNKQTNYVIDMDTLSFHGEVPKNVRLITAH